MAAENNEGLNVLDMAQAYADANDMDVDDLFKKEETPVAKDPEPKPETTDSTDDTTYTPVRSESTKKGWTPDASLLEGMDEFTSAPVTYAKDDIKEESDDKTLVNISDDKAIDNSKEALNEMDRKQQNIEEAKKRHGIKYLNIPPEFNAGELHAKIFAAAGDTDHDRAQSVLDELFEMVKNDYPEFITEWYPGFGPNPTPTDTATDDNVHPVDDVSTTADTENMEDTPKSSDVSVVIDKRQVSEVVWTKEEAEKIKTARTVELNIVEVKNLEFSEIEEADTNLIDKILAPYQRKIHDTAASLPASKYRATFTGLSYPEIIDLQNAVEMNTLDGERMKWSICFSHIKNPSIGEFQEYRWYIDPETKAKTIIAPGSWLPAGINENDIHDVSKFDDFLMKTSFLDLDFMLWQILCATSMDKEILTIQCGGQLENGKQCGHSYEWVYSPSDLLIKESISPAVLEEMKTTGEAMGDEIMKNYETSFLRAQSTVKLPSSELIVIFGHVSAYNYLETVYGLMKDISDTSEYDPTSESKAWNYAALIAVKGFLIQNGKKYARVSLFPDGEEPNVEKIVDILKSLNELDWQTVNQLIAMVINPYKFSYSIRDLKCPKCHNSSSIPIESIARLLFIVTRSLSNVNVVLKKQ